MIADDFLEEVKCQSNDELRRIAVNFNMHRGALVAAAKRELANRGVELNRTSRKLKTI